jgi:hypothetical protein
VLAWNLQNLFDGVDDGTEYREFDPGTGTWDDRLFRRRLDRTGEVILSSVRGGPDIVVFCEIENRRVLEELRDGPLRGRGYQYTVITPGPGAVRTAVASRFPILCVEIRHTGWWGERELRPLLRVDIDIGGEVLHLLAVHWKSPRDGRSATEPARRDEAETAANLIRELLSGSLEGEILLIGDLNTEGTGVPLPAALAPWPPLPDEPDAGIYRTEVPGDEGIREGRVVLHDPEPDTTAGPPGTYRWEGRWERPDRALLSPGLLDDRGLTFTRCRVAAFETMVDRYGNPWRWITAEEEGYSDHLPLLLEFRRVADRTAESATLIRSEIPGGGRKFT